MAIWTGSRVVTAPVQVVWETLADFGGISRWGRGVDESSALTEATEGVGATRRVQVGRNTLREKVTVWEAGHRLGYQLIGLPPVVRAASNTWTLRTAMGQTQVTLATQVETRGGPLVGWLVARKLGRAGEQLLDGLQEHHAQVRS